MNDIIPEIGQWVECRGMDLGPGRVIRIEFEMNRFTAEFFGEPNLDGSSTAEEGIVSFLKIERIITDPEEIARLEKEMQ